MLLAPAQHGLKPTRMGRERASCPEESEGSPEEQCDKDMGSLTPHIASRRAGKIN